MRIFRDPWVLKRPGSTAVGRAYERAVVPARPSVVSITKVNSGQAVLGRIRLNDPGVAGVGGLNYVSIAAHHPACPSIQEVDVEEKRGDRHVEAVPAQTAVCRA